MHGQIQINKVSFDKDINCKIDFTKEKMNDYGLDYGELQFKEINQCTTLRNNSFVDHEGLHINNDMVVFGDADSYMNELSLECKFENELEIGFACTGRLNYTCIVLRDSEILLKSYKNSKKGFTSDRKICKINLDNFNYVKLSYKNCKLFVIINNQEFTFDCIIEKGALLFRTENNANLAWCQFAMSNTHK